MSINKLVIGPKNVKAIKFFDELDRKKAELKSKAEAKLNKLLATKNH